MSVYEDLKWGKSFLGKNLSLYASSALALHGKASPILFIGGVHGDEPEGVELAKKTLLWLQSEDDQKQTQNRPHWILIPCLNLDGYTAKERTNAQGIDLNRNFPSPDWKKSEEKNRYYSGEHPMESPEVAQLVQLIQVTRPKVIVHAHSWKPCIVCTGPENHPYAQMLAKSSGYELVNDIGYPTPGSLGNYGWLQLKIPVICIEEQEHIDLSLVWPHFKSGIQQMFLNTV